MKELRTSMTEPLGEFVVFCQGGKPEWKFKYRVNSRGRLSHFSITLKKYCHRLIDSLWVA